MAFGISRAELSAWKRAVSRNEIAYLTHYWIDPRFPHIHCVTKVGCADLHKLQQWCKLHDLPVQYIHQREPFPHFDLIGPKQKEILAEAGLHSHIERFRL